MEGKDTLPLKVCKKNYYVRIGHKHSGRSLLAILKKNTKATYCEKMAFTYELQCCKQIIWLYVNFTSHFQILI